MARIIKQKVSVIVPAYNEQRDISTCLASLGNQDYSNMEIIVVDDGSTDNTVPQIKKFPVLLLTQTHLGAGPARNLGAKHSSGKILIFVDADMTFSPEFISNLIRPILEQKTIGTFSKEELVSNPQNIWSMCWNINKNLPLNQLHPRDYPDAQAVFRAILKSEFLRVGGFDPIGYNDDWTLSQKLGVLATSAPNAVFYHRNPDSISEIWHQASWIGKRPYKLEVIGKLVTLIRSSLPISLFIGLYKSVIFLTPKFLIFKLLYDLAIFKSVLFSFFIQQNYK